MAILISQVSVLVAFAFIKRNLPCRQQLVAAVFQDVPYRWEILLFGVFVDIKKTTHELA